MKLAEAFSWLVTKNCTFEISCQGRQFWDVSVRLWGPGTGLLPLLREAESLLPALLFHQSHKLAWKRTKWAQRAAHLPLCPDSKLVPGRAGEHLSRPEKARSRWCPSPRVVGNFGWKRPSQGSASLHAGSGHQRLCPHPGS